ncbi:MAG: hypothetical protein KGJ43_02820 [Acidobacteriota bacterium]|nr:hypothetical protein [Acidobacteriota bacterium]
MSSLSLSHIPRRVQIALVVAVALVVLWMAVLRNMVNNSSSSSSSSAGAPSTATTPHRPVTAPASRGTAATETHRAAGGAGALAHRAGGAAATHARTATGAAARSATHPLAAPRSSTGHAATAPAATRSHAATSHGPATTRTAPPTTAARAHAPGLTKSPHAPQPTTAVSSIEEQLGAGKVVLILIWDPSATTDRYVHHELEAAARSLGRAVAVHFGTASQVSDFGDFSKKVLITETPTILLVTPSKQVTTLTGYTEATSIKQAVAEAQAAERAASAKHHAATRP